MATWDDLVAYVRSGYRVVRESSDEIRIEVGFEEDERTQIVILTRAVLDGREDWVQVLSFCGRTVRWYGQSFTIDHQGRLRRATP